MKTKKKLGRPSTINWSKFTLLWKNLTDSEIAARAECTTVNVFTRRLRLIAKAKEDGKDSSFFVCQRGKWARGKHTLKHV